ncbi:MAG: NAD(P)/FAD-dependent oxidoreductase, partial [candidate division Zixibacteria bacterium]|nr:NAD(P)/FAD-dependent oxidoreductase [candidate division Zixibacteria bacterium]
NSGINFQIEEVLELDYEKGEFYIKTDKRVLTSSIAVIASGTKPRKLTDLRVTPDIDKRIFYEVYPLIQVENQKIAIIGCGDAAFDYALNLSKRNQVIILNRGEKEKCLPLLWERAKEIKNISYEKDTQVKEIIPQGQGLRLVCQNHSGECEMDISCLVIAIGRDPNLDFLSENLKGKLVKLQSSKALFIIGDVKNGLYRQTGIATGEGIKNAMEIKMKISGEDS